MSLIDNWHTEDALMEEDMKKNLAEETPIEEVITEEVIETPEVVELDPDEIISEDFGVICKQDGEVIAYGFWTGTRGNVQRLEEWAEYGYEKTSDKYVQGYNGKWYIEGTEPEKPAPTYEEVQKARADAYASEVDPLMAEYNRKKTFNLFEEGEEEALLAEIEAKVEEIKTLYPYSVEEISNVEENFPYPEETLTEPSSSNIIETSETDINSILGE